MTRREREITDPQKIKEILCDCSYLHLGLVDEGRPYVVPMNYGLKEEDGHYVIYLHGATTGRKLEIIQKNPICCFTMERNVILFEGKVACQYGTAYECVMGTGQISIVNDTAEKIAALECIMETQTGKEGFSFNDRMVSIVSVMRIDVEDISAKYRPLPGAEEREADKE